MGLRARKVSGAFEKQAPKLKPELNNANPAFELATLLEDYLTIRPVAPKGYGSIAHEVKPNGFLTRGP